MSRGQNFRVIGYFCLLLAVTVLAIISCSPNLLAEDSAGSKVFPADAVFNVRSYGAQGDGQTDDTAAIQKAIQENVGKLRILFFPQGTYLVSDTLTWRDAEGHWQCWLSLQGENAETTVLRLKDATFTDPNRPRPVIMTANQNPLDAEGGGNQAFGNSICDLTVDVGAANPGAIGIDYLANNKGTIENVIVRSSDPERVGRTGVAMCRAWLGPCFLKNVRVEGFDYGMDAAHSQISVTLEHIVLNHQRVCGLRNADNCLAIRDLQSDNKVPAVNSRQADSNQDGPAGLVVLLDSKLLGGDPAAVAVDNSAHLFIRNVVTGGYGAAIRDREQNIASVANGEYASQLIRGKFGVSALSLNLPVVETPTYWDNDLSHWKSVGQPDGIDDTARIQAALDSGASTVYFPPGRYHIADTLRIRGRVRHLIGMEAEILSASNHTFKGTSAAKPIFRFETPDDGVPGVVFERFNVMNFSDGGTVIENASRKDLVIKGVFSWAAGGAYRNEPGAGRLFIEDFCYSDCYQNRSRHQSSKTIFHSQQVWARQFNPEPRFNPELAFGPRIVNEGGTLWILGYKTEGFGPILVTNQGGRSEVLGGFHYWNSEEEDQKLPKSPAYVVENGDISVSFVTQRHQEWDPEPYFREVRGGETRDTGREELPGRFGAPSNWARAVPLFISRTEEVH